MKNDPVEELIEAAEEFVGAFGGDVPDWLQAEYDRLSYAIDAVKGVER